MKIKPQDIIWPERVREDFGYLGDLKDSILQDGLGAPVIINKNNVLIDGGRRLKAWLEEKGNVPIEVHIYDGDTDPVVMEIRMEATTKKFSPDELYHAIEILEEIYKPQARANQRAGTSLSQDSEVARVSKKVSEDLGIGEAHYFRTKKVMGSEIEKELPDGKVQTIRKIAREEGIKPAFREYLKEHDKLIHAQAQKAEEHPAVMDAAETAYLSKLSHAYHLIEKYPGKITEEGYEKILKAMRSIIRKLQEITGGEL